MRKHRSQMLAAEITALESFIHERILPRLGYHADNRMAQKGISPKELDLALQFGKLIEVHKEAWEARALLRHDTISGAVCVVVGLESKRTITTWKNDADDFHNTLDMTPYNWKVDARQLI